MGDDCIKVRFVLIFDDKEFLAKVFAYIREIGDNKNHIAHTEYIKATGEKDVQIS